MKPLKPTRLMLPEVLETARLRILRNRMGKGFGLGAGRERAELVFAAVDDDRARLAKYLPWVESTQKVSDSEAYLSACEEKWESGTLFDYGIFLKSGEFIGNGGLHSISGPDRRAEIGYWIVSKYEGQGFMTEAVEAMARAAFAAGFHRLEIHCNEENAKSYGVAERLGFRLEGTLRDRSIEHGKFRNTRIYGLLAGELSIS
jgi:hypothetical protein